MKNSTIVKLLVKFGLLFLIFWGVLKALTGENLTEVSEMPVWKAALAIAGIAALLDLITDKLLPADSKVGQFLRY